ncbi:MAG TPA: hypothetical protein PLM14_12575 [Candidatus Hydrogenedentes bacterium]|nr:hypothetical protein [Candidatus Hydrogenedentota bacterium]
MNKNVFQRATDYQMNNRLRRLFIAAIPAIVAYFHGSCYAAADAPLALTGHSQLFLDDYLINSMENLARAIVHPDKHPANPLVSQDLPWEARCLEIYGTVLYEQDRDLFRCWYLGSEHNGDVPDTPEHPKTAEYVTCYAESRDGIVWSKPFAGPKPYGSRKEHNILIEGTHGFCVLNEPDEPDSLKKYKGAGGPLFGFSPDGIHWETHDWRPAVGKNDTSSCVVRWKDEYLAYVRSQISDPNWPGVMRGVGLSVSSDFQTWAPKTTIFTTDAIDGYPWVQPYGVSVTPYGDVLVGILWMLHLDRVDGNNGVGEQDTQLIVSRDGRNWHRVAERQPFLTPTSGSWDRGGVFPGTTMFTKDDRLYIYYTGKSGRHGEGSGAMGIGLATLPADRFVAVRQVDTDKPGILVTRLLRFSGDDLLVNADIGNGDMDVEILDEDGRPLGGFTQAHCQLIPVDPLRYRVAWISDGKAQSLGDAKAQRAWAFRFVLRGGALYAFRVIESGKP